MNALVLFACTHRWESEFLETLRLIYNVKVAYVNEVYQKYDYLSGINEINQIIHANGIEVVLFNIDFFNYIDNLFVGRINSRFKILFSHDDVTLHYRNVVTTLLTKVNSIIVADPISVLKYKSVGVNAFFLPLEGGNIYENRKNIEVKDFDIVFIGSLLKADRYSFVEAIKRNGFSVLVAGGEISSLSYQELTQLMARAKIILNFTKSAELNKNSSDGFLAYKYEFKGRVLEAGFSGSLCLSEYSPSMELLFPDDSIPMFKNLHECTLLLDKLLNNEYLYQCTRDKFIAQCQLLRPSSLIKRMDLLLPVGGGNIKYIPVNYLIESIVSRPILNRNVKITYENLRVVIRDLNDLDIGCVNKIYVFGVIVTYVIMGIFRRLKILYRVFMK